MSTLSGDAEGYVGQLKEKFNGFTFEEGSFDGFITNFMTSVMPSDDDISTEVTTLITDLTTTINNHADDMETAGFNLDYGLARGIRNGSASPIMAMNVVAGMVVNAANQAFRIKSPSKIFEEIGMFNMLGLANGTSEYGEDAISRVRTVSDDYISEMKEAFAPLAAMEAAGIDANPVITPVLDMSRIRSGLSGMNSMLGGSYGVNMMPSFGRNIQVPDVTASISASNTYMQSMNERLDQLNANITNLQVVLDSGILVGAMGPKLDKWLGSQASRYSRG